MCLGGYVRECSDTLLIFLLKGLRPEKYRDRMEVRGSLAQIDIDKLPDDVIQAIIDGTHPWVAIRAWIERLRAAGQPVPAGLLAPAGDLPPGTSGTEPARGS